VEAVEGVRQVCDLDGVRAVFQDEAHAGARWPLVFYALWWTIHVAGATREEAAEAVLGGVAL
jgi:hypothetical protein